MMTAQQWKIYVDERPAVTVPLMIRGKCITHEVDVIAGIGYQCGGIG